MLLLLLVDVSFGARLEAHMMDGAPVTDHGTKQALLLEFMVPSSGLMPEIGGTGRCGQNIDHWQRAVCGKGRSEERREEGEGGCEMDRGGDGDSGGKGGERERE